MSKNQKISYRIKNSKVILYIMNVFKNNDKRIINLIIGSLVFFVISIILFVFLNINARSSDNLTNKKSDNEIRFVEDKASNIETRKPFGFYYLENQINDREFYIYIYNIKKEFSNKNTNQGTAINAIRYILTYCNDTNKMDKRNFIIYSYIYKNVYNKEYYASLNAENKKIFIGIDSVCNKFDEEKLNSVKEEFNINYKKFEEDAFGKGGNKYVF